MVTLRHRSIIRTILGILALGFLSSGPILAKESTKTKIWESTYIPGFSIYKANCWKIGESKRTMFAVSVDVSPTDSCPKVENGIWKMNVVVLHPGTKIESGSDTKLISSDSFQQTIKNNGESITFYQEPSSTILQWKALVRCFDTNIYPQYDEQMEPGKLEELKKKRQIPSVFKDFVVGMKCDKSKAKM